MIRGDLVHLPQGTLLLRGKHTNLADAEFLKAKKPMRALFWDRDPSEPKWGSVYYKQSVWDVRMKDIYPIAEELQNVS
jgi:hypothetical protein